jgi:hypothetical protein
MINNQKILYKFIQTNKNVDWYSISYEYTLSENFIREFKDKVNWTSITFIQKLSENFVREFQVKVNYDYVLYYQNLNLYENFKSKST